jgi:hypothetical protein
MRIKVPRIPIPKLNPESSSPKVCQLTVDGDVVIEKARNSAITVSGEREDHPVMFVGREKQRYSGIDVE